MATTIPLIDTCIIIEALRGNKKWRYCLKQTFFYYSIVTEKELFKKQNLRKREIIDIKNILSNGRKIFLDTQILDGVRVIAPIYRKKHINDRHDIIIGATALVKKIPLVTLNRKHFSFIKGLKLIDLKSV